MQIIEANLSGELNLKIETELVCVTTHFKDLGNPLLGKISGGLCFAFDKLLQVTHLTELSKWKDVRLGWLCFHASGENRGLRGCLYSGVGRPAASCH